MRRISVFFGVVLSLAACSKSDDAGGHLSSDGAAAGAGNGGDGGLNAGGSGGVLASGGAAGVAGLSGSGGVAGEHCGYGGYTAGTDGGGIGGSEVPHGGTGGECPHSGSGGVSGANGDPMENPFDKAVYEEFSQCQVTPELAVSISTDCQQQNTSFDVAAMRAVLESFRDRSLVKVVATTNRANCSTTNNADREVVIVGADGMAASAVRKEWVYDPPEYSFRRCALLAPEVFQACLDTLASGPYDNCAERWFESCQGAPVSCE